MHMGPDFILVNVSVDFTDGLPAGKVEKPTAAIDQAIKKVFPYVKRVSIEAESLKWASLFKNGAGGGIRTLMRQTSGDFDLLWTISLFAYSSESPHRFQ